jgi:hypothetical protein
MLKNEIDDVGRAVCHGFGLLAFLPHYITDDLRMLANLAVTSSFDPVTLCYHFNAIKSIREFAVWHRLFADENRNIHDSTPLIYHSKGE